jgi:membrane-associated protease RseP (regulator of RpoE activity)
MASLIALNVPLMAPLIAQLILPNLASSPVISLHPLAVIGFVTFLVNALQLLPIGRLDGGRVATAVLGGGQAGFVSGLTLTLLGFSTLFGGDNPILLFWGLIIIFLQRQPELPCADDITGVDTTRTVLAAVAGVVTLLTLLPCPLQSVAAPLGGF